MATNHRCLGSGGYLIRPEVVNFEGSPNKAGNVPTVKPIHSTFSVQQMEGALYGKA
ncbi:MAG: hypothetical protein HC767_05900 [Akkermansiaceae bacterium]|nr:hypothetical protein [Akkermansiaceae bacterium]